MAFYDAIPASDGTSLEAPTSAEFKVFEVYDTARANPLPLRTTAGLNAAPLMTTAQGVVPPVEVVSPNFEHIFQSGEWEWRRDSFDGMKKDAAASADSAEASRVAAEEAVRNTTAPTKEAIAAALTTDGAAKDALGAEVRSATSGLAIKPDNGGKPVGKGEIVVNVRDYGAKGDGVSDDLNAFTQAIRDASNAGGGTLFLPPGTYNLSANPKAVDNLSVSGYGATMTRGFSGLSDRGRGYGAGPRNVSISGIRFLGSFTDSRRVVGMEWHHAQNLVVENCTFEQAISWGHTFDLQGCDGVTIRNCTWLGFDNMGPNAAPYTEAIQLDVSALGGASAAEMDLTRYDALPTRNVLVEKCQFLPLTVNGVTYPCPNPLGSHAGLEDTFYEGVVFRNNYVRHPGASGDWYPGALHFIGARGLKIHDNTFEGLPGVSSTAIFFSDGRYVSYPSQAADPGSSTHISDDPVTPRNISIQGNTFVGWTSGTQPIINYVGDFRGNYAFGLDIMDNEFRDCRPSTGSAPNPISLKWAANVRVAGNNFLQARRIGDFTDCKSVQIRNNNVTDCEFNGIYAARVQGLQIIGNEFQRISYFLNLTQVNGLLIAHNGFEEPIVSAGCVILQDITGGQVMNNRLRGTNPLYGFSWRGATTRSQCRNNIIDPTIAKGVDVVSPAVVDVGSNI